MLKYLLLPLMFLTLAFQPARAADDELSGKVTAIEGTVVTMEVMGEMPAWLKKGAYLRTTTAEGKVILRGAKITEVTGNIIVVKTPRAKDKVVGQVYKLAKGKAAAGC